MCLQITESFKSAPTTESFKDVQRADSFTRTESGRSTRSSANRIPKDVAWVQRTDTPDSTSTVDKDVEIEDLFEGASQNGGGTVAEIGCSRRNARTKKRVCRSILGTAAMNDVEKSLTSQAVNKQWTKKPC